MRKRTFWLRSTSLAVLAIVALAVAVAGCGGGDSSTGTESASASDSTEATNTEANSNPAYEPAAANAPTKKVELPKETIGILAVALADPGSKKDVENYEDVFAKLGWDTVVVDGQGVPSKSDAGLQTLVQKKPDAIVLEYVEPNVVTQGIKAAEEADIPVIATGSDTGSPLVTASFGGDNTTTAALMVNFVATVLGQKGTVGLVAGDSQSFSKQKTEQFERQMASLYPAMKLVVQQVDYAKFASESTAATNALINQNPDLKAIVSTPAFASYVVQAVEQAGKSDELLITSFEEVEPLSALLQEGKVDAISGVATTQMVWQVADSLAQHFARDTPISPAEQAMKFPEQQYIYTKDTIPDGEPPFTPPVDPQKFYEDLWSESFTNYEG